MLSELAFPHIRCCLSAIPSYLMKSTAVDEILFSMNQHFCSRENQLLQMLQQNEKSTQMKGMCSNTFDLPFGVPQGSCLGPVLFTQYASSLFSIFSNRAVSAHAYTDDHQLYMAFSPNLESQNQAVSCMESCLDDVKSWMISNKLKMNDSKTEFIIISSHQQLAKIDLTRIRVGESSISAVDDVWNLRVYLG